MIQEGDGRCDLRPAKPLRPSLALGHLPCEGEALDAGEARKRHPTQWGAGREAGLRGFARLRLPGAWPPLSFLYKERTKEILMYYPKK